jgi:hypothetical protein
MFRLVESFRNLSSEHGVHRTHHNEEDRISESDHIGGVDVRRAHQKIVLSGRVVMYGPGRRNHHPDSVYEDLQQTFDREAII